MAIWQELRRLHQSPLQTQTSLQHHPKLCLPAQNHSHFSLPENVLQDDFRLASLSLLLASHLMPLPLSHFPPSTLMLYSALNPCNFAPSCVAIVCEGTWDTKDSGTFIPGSCSLLTWLKTMSSNITSVSRDKQHIEVISLLGKHQTFCSSKIQPLE